MVEKKHLMPNRTTQSRINGGALRKAAWPETAQIMRLLFCLLFIFLLASSNQTQAASKFKSFKLESLDGTTRTLDDFKNKATLIAFFFPTCTYCNQAFPETVRIYEKYKDQGLSMVWINIVEDEVDLIPDWQAKHQYQVPVLIGASRNT